MNWNQVLTIYLKELKDSLRDRRTLMSMIIIPTFVIPGLMFGVGKIAANVFSKAREEIPSIMVLGGDKSSNIVVAIKESKKFKIVPSSEDFRTQISDKKIRAVVRFACDCEASIRSGVPSSVIIYNYDGELKSSFAVSEVERFFRDLRDKTVAQRLNQRSLPADLLTPFTTQRENVAPPEKVGGNAIGGIVPYIIILLCFTGAMYPAIDLTAGEKERGTMETLLCSPVGRMEIVVGKFLMVLTGSVGAMLLSLTSMALNFVIGGSFMSGSGAKVAAAAAKAQNASGMIPLIDPVGVLGVVAMVVSLAVLFSAVIFTVALFAKSYKEAQSYVAPMIIVIIMPAVVGMLPGIDLNMKIALIPILNLSLVCKEMLSGIWHWQYIGVIFGSSCVYAVIALLLAVKMFNREDVIFRT